MSDPYVGEIRLVGFAFAPEGWSFCDGSLISIANSDVLFNLIGTTYGGDGVNTFALPDLRGRAPLHMGSYQGTSYVIGQKAGTEQVALITGNLPSHSHTVGANSAAAQNPLPTGNTFAANNTIDPYETSGPGVSGPILAPNGGGAIPHENLMPYLTMNYIISLFGVYPSQS
jgi:microcystin-dependent protein